MLKGGLGNMMFQIAAGYSKSLELKQEFSYTLDNWNCVTGYKIDSYPTAIFKNINCINIKDIKGVRTKVYNEPSNLYSRIPDVDPKVNLVVDGYFQSEKYFKENKKEIKNLFSLTELEKYKDYTFMHFRRKDYLLYSDVHNVLTQDYYHNALKVLQPKKILIVSDDIDWCKKNMKGNNIEFVEGTTDLEDLTIMLSCKHGAIIANSTFSWWGAWLGGAAKVVAPKKWFNHIGPIKNWSDIYVPSWITI